MNLLGYIRYSTLWQEDSLETQTTVLRQWAEANGHAILEAWSDEAESGGGMTKRKELLRVITIAHARQYQGQPVDGILFYKLDRAFRNSEDQAVTLNALRRRGLQVLYARDPNVGGHQGKLIETVLGGVNEFERALTGERIRDSNMVRAENGRWTGGQAPFGYVYHRSEKVQEGSRMIVVTPGWFEKHPDEGLQLEFLKEMALAGHSAIELVRFANAKGWRPRQAPEWNRTSMIRVMSNEFHAGKVRYNRFPTDEGGRVHFNPDYTVADGKQEAYWTWEEHQRIQAALRPLKHGNRAERVGRRATHEGRALLAGKIRCTLCGGAAVAGHSVKVSPILYSYHCRGASDGGKCKGWSRRGHHIERVVLARIDALSLLWQQAPDLGQPQKASQSETAGAARLSALRAELERHKRAYAAGLDSLEEYAANKRRVLAEIARLESAKTPAGPSPEEIKATWLLLKDWGNLWDATESVKARRLLLDKLIDSTECDGLKLVVHWRSLPLPGWPGSAETLALPPKNARLWR